MEKINRPTKPDPYVTKKVNYKVRYITKKDFLPLDLQEGHIYQWVAEIIEEPQKGYLGIIDESSEAYVYSPNMFEKVE